MSRFLHRVVDAPKPNSLIAGHVAKPATLHKRHEAASANEYAVAQAGAGPLPGDDCPTYTPVKVASEPPKVVPFEATATAADVVSKLCPRGRDYIANVINAQEYHNYLSHCYVNDLGGVTSEMVDEQAAKLRSTLAGALVWLTDRRTETRCPKCADVMNRIPPDPRGDPSVGLNPHGGGHGCDNCGHTEWRKYEPPVEPEKSDECVEPDPFEPL